MLPVSKYEGVTLFPAWKAIQCSALFFNGHPENILYETLINKYTL